MRLNHLLHANQHKIFASILAECGDFFTQAVHEPLQKSLPRSYNDIHRVKVRKRKTRSNFGDTFNEAFTDETHQLRQRAIFANGVITESGEEEPFYIFPPNGFSFIYSTEVTNSTEQYRSVFESILSTLDDEAEMTFQDLLKFTYKSDNLEEGINSGAEIIIYNTSYYYSVRQTAYPNYEELLSLLHGE